VVAASREVLLGKDGPAEIADGPLSAISHLGSLVIVVQEGYSQ
jgi:hypothetical protein